MSLLKHVFSVKEKGNFITIRILGIKIKHKKIKTKPSIEEIFNNKNSEVLSCLNDMKTLTIQSFFNQLELFRQSTILQSKSFDGYKNIYEGKDVVLVATGPTLNDFQPIKNAVYVGVNRAFLCDKITLDYLFMQDYLAVKDYIEQSYPYKNNELKRFYGILQTEIDKNWIIPEKTAIKHNAERYYAWAAWNPKRIPIYENFALDITTRPLACFGSVVFPAMQFILYTNPRRIYLVGCDCADTGQFNDPMAIATNPSFSAVKNGWMQTKKFKEIFYPETEIISVNPEGLKGLFKDIYQ